MYYNANTERIDFVSYRSTIRNQSLRDINSLSPMLCHLSYKLSKQSKKK